MTVMLTVAVKPKDGLKPYILMGSDSLQIKGYPIYSDQGELIDIEVHEKDENYKKIFKVSNKLIGMTGRHNDEFTNLILSHIEENDTNLGNLTRSTLNYVKDLVENDIETEQQRITITFGAIEKGNPVVSYIEVDTRDLPETIIDVIEVDQKGSFVPVFAGNRKKTKDLQKEFNHRVLNNCINFNMTSVRKAAYDYLFSSAERYPLTCNKNIVFERLR